MSKKAIFIVLIFLIFVDRGLATHQRAAELTYRHIEGMTYEFKLVTYTYTPSLADRPELEINWGDGTKSKLPRIEKIELPGVSNITRNTYIGRHTYNAPATYVVSMEDPNRNYGVLNIPYSVNVPMYISTTIVVNPFIKSNSSPILTFPPIDIACVGQPFYHNPGAYDPDGDSLAFRLVPCRGENGQNIIGYSYPAASKSFSIDSITGTLTWDSPILQGEYNIAIVIEEYRKGILISSITRDMQILVIACNNIPPEISTIKDTCVMAGTHLSFKVYGDDANDKEIYLSATGSPFEQSISPAEFYSVAGNPVISSTFNWKTHCAHIKRQPHNVYFRLEDRNQTVNLIDIHVTRILVVCPKTEIISAEPQGNKIKLMWRKNICANVRGYKIYRREGFYGFVPNHCQVGVPPYTGYKMIYKTESNNDTIFVDSNNGRGLKHGIEYCYMIVAYFEDGAESYASDEICTSLIKDIPIITQVDVVRTDEKNGKIKVVWTRPIELDTINFPGPYEYKIYRSLDTNYLSGQLIKTYSNKNDTTFVDSLIDTKNKSYFYTIEFWDFSRNEAKFLGNTNTASSVFLEIEPFDKALILKWKYDVPWVNTSFVVFRWNNETMSFDSIAEVTENKYIDYGLQNHKEYCYKILAIGTYFSKDIADPLLNHSQEACGIPYDMVPPCAPFLEVEKICHLSSNRLRWTNPAQTCDFSSDVAKYNVYFAQTDKQLLELIHTETDVNVTTYFHNQPFTVAGCYAVQAVDSVGNQSELSNKVCVDIEGCSLYRLPNVFTPNGDGYNDYWMAFDFDFVEKIDLQVFNRWGNVVYETQDAHFKWDGKHYKNNQDVSEGTYFYLCDVYEIRLEGRKKRTISGSLTIIRSPNKNLK